MHGFQSSSPLQGFGIPLWGTGQWYNDGLALLGDAVLDTVILDEGIDISKLKPGVKFDKKGTAALLDC